MLRLEYKPFDFEPQLCYIVRDNPLFFYNSALTIVYFILWVPGITTINVSSSDATNTFSHTGTNLSWYSTNLVDYQLNVSGKTYYYIAIG